MDLLHEGLKQSTVHVNVGQEMIVITEDKMRLSLDALIGKAKNRQSWHAPAGMLLTEVGVLATAKFHDAAGLSGDQWRTLFYVLIFLTLGWLLTSLAKGKPEFTVDSFIESLKNLQRRPQTSSMEVFPGYDQRPEVTHFAMNVSLSPELEKFVRDSVSTGRYTSASELVREALRLLQETDRANKAQEALAQVRLRELQLEIAKSPLPSELKFSRRSRKKGKAVKA
jgi:antitoxin ParD1/3/4